jgi:hypothetical protein
MKFIDDYIKLLFPDSRVSTSKENAQEFNAIFLANSYSSIDYKELEQNLTFVQKRDSFHCSVTFGNSDPIIINSANLDFKLFVANLDQESLYIMDVEISIDITITKTINDLECTIYDLETFINTLKGFDANQFFTVFSKLITTNQGIKFKVYSLKSSFCTSTISFSSISNEFKNIGNPKRDEIFENFKSQCHFTNIDNFKLFPDDFHFIEIDPTYTEIKNLFKLYSNLLAIIYLFDITSLKGNQIEYKINGYKAIKGVSELNKAINESFDEYYEIYDWVYNGGNLNDKIGLARNIISLHFAENGELDLHGQPFQSVKSSFKVYEKQNIKQYIEIRNKISDQLLEFNNRANKIVETFAVGFQKSSLALISFYISAIVIRVLSKGEFVNIFSLDATVLSLAFLLGSFAYFWVSKWEIKEQRKRFVDSYHNLKERYTDLLEKDDIKKILNDDKEFNEDVKFIDSKQKIYSRLWLLVLSLLAGSTIFLFVSYNLAQLLDSFIITLLFGKVSD